MSFELLGNPIKKIGVVGSGQIGPDIALYFAKVFASSEIKIVVVDVSEEALEKGKAKLAKKVDRGVASGAFSSEMADAMKSSVTFTSDYEMMRGVDFVVEAATEDEQLKGKIFKQLEGLCSDTTVFASNSSHLEPEVIFANTAHKERTLVIHYFFPAERNPVVEIVPSKDTAPELTQALMRLYENIGKTPICVGSRYGYAIDPIFEGLFLAAALLVEAGAGTTKEVDAAACRALGYTVGPFTAMNLTGGNPITNHGLDQSHKKIMPWFRSPKSLADKVASGEKWDTPARGENIELPEQQEKTISDALRGAYFGLVGEIIDSGISNVADMDMALEIALDMTPPFRLMNKLGVKESLALVENYAKNHDGFKVPDCLREQAKIGKPWSISTVLRRDTDGVAVITIRRPKVLNALNQDAFLEIERHFTDLKNDDSIQGIVITGFGKKAFVSGADVHFLAKIDSAEAGIATSSESNRVLQAIENVGKPTVCALNGFALGGGNELAMACNARIGKKGLKLFAGQPEPNLGIIPGAGATQRLPRWIGVEKAAEMLRTGRPISSKKALELGLISQEVEGDVLTAAIDLVRQAFSGKVTLPSIVREPIDVPEALPDLDLGHLSRAVDAIVVRSILEGCRMPLSDGLAFESQMFGEICKTRDMRIGVDNFIKNGPSKKANFEHA